MMGYKNEHIFAWGFLDPTESSANKSWTSFDPSKRLLLAKMPTPGLSTASIALMEKISTTDR
jgi:hypothetical protein